ncbi:AAA family ATPase, partial [Streptomyces sp. NPDC001633]|uniref:AAA family ATPase n=1 Tax=Streptomyces sp. NPDC001633 TaxID=3364595 RepID=UPI0036A9D9B5
AESDFRKQKRELADAQVKLARRKRYGQKMFEQKREPKIVMGARKRAAQESAGKHRIMHEERLTEAKERLDEAVEAVRDDDEIRVDLPYTAVPPGRGVLTLRDLELVYGARVAGGLDLHGPERIALIGRNGSGKTTLLRAMALALTGPAVARSLVPQFENWVTEERTAGQVEVEISRDTQHDRFSQGRPPAHDFRAGLRWKTPRDGMAGRVPVRRGVQSGLDEIRYTKAQTSIARRGPWADNPAGWFSAAYGPFRRMAGGSGEVQRLMLASGPVARHTSLFHEDASLAEGVAWLIEQHLRALEGRGGARGLKTFALALLGDGLLPDGYRIDDVDSEGLWVERHDSRFPLREMSDGFRTVAALVV